VPVPAALPVLAALSLAALSLAALSPAALSVLSSGGLLSRDGPYRSMSPADILRKRHAKS